MPSPFPRRCRLVALLCVALLCAARPATGRAQSRPTDTTQLGPRFFSADEAESTAVALFAAGRGAEARRIVAVSTAHRWLGSPYGWGAVGTRGAIDCSALVRAAYLRAGITLPRVSRDQAALGVAVVRRVDALALADLLVFGKASTGAITHVGLYLGGGWFVHSASATGGVTVSRLADPQWTHLWLGARRIIAEDAPTR
ncbi:MAG TPA: C40 family peptidase [Gemmatimonadaceae bacterium]|nr:C40 family peptidase [Gemmatimonadaceae bacterium]